MEHTRGQVNRDAALVYQEFFVPALFAEWAPRVANVARLESAEHVLDVATGTGVLIREAALRVGEQNALGLDVNPGMLAVARRVAPNIEFREGRAEALPFETNRFDAVISQFGLMFFEDRPRALQEMLRVLRPGGRLAIAVWASLDQTPGYRAMASLLERLFGAAIAAELRAPYCLGNVQTLERLFVDAGLPQPTICTLQGAAQFPSLADWVHTDVKGWTLAERLDDDACARLLEQAELELSGFVDHAGVRFAHPAHIISLSKPS